PIRGSGGRRWRLRRALFIKAPVTLQRCTLHLVLGNLSYPIAWRVDAFCIPLISCLKTEKGEKDMRLKILILSLVILVAAVAASAQEWPQWGHDPQHTGRVGFLGQVAAQILDDVIYDPHVNAEKADNGGDLLVHYQVPLIDGNNIYMEFKSGTFTDTQHWETQIWNEKRLRWQGNHLVEQWSFQSDWDPPPFGTIKSGPFWEPVFHAALANGAIYIPGAGGTVFRVNKTSGALITRINPFGSSIDPDTFVAGPLSADAAGNIYYNAVKLKHGNSWNQDVDNSWLVKIAPNNSFQTATFASLN